MLSIRSWFIAIHELCCLWPYFANALQQCMAKCFMMLFSQCFKKYLNALQFNGAIEKEKNHRLCYSLNSYALVIMLVNLGLAMNLTPQVTWCLLKLLDLFTDTADRQGGSRYLNPDMTKIDLGSGLYLLAFLVSKALCNLYRLGYQFSCRRRSQTNGHGWLLCLR